MHWCAVVLCVLWCVGVSTGTQCLASRLSVLNFSIVSRRNQTGNWIAQVQLGHEAGKKDSGPWEVDIDHTTAKCEDTESVLIALTLSAPPLRAPPGPGYELIPELGYYKLHNYAKTWPEALKICEQEGAHLLVINSEQEAKAMQPFWNKNPTISEAAHNTHFFIGFHDQFKEGEYVTIFNNTLASAGYLNWNGTPNSGTVYSCGVFIRNNYKMDLLQCNIKLGFFCEQEL